MEHPYLFLVKVFEAIGFGHFAHLYPHVIYSWFVMLLLIILAVLATRKIEMIPTKGQNFFEIVISGMEEFMVDITGEEGRWFFPIIATIFIYIVVCNLLGLVPGFFPPTASLNTTVSCAIPVFVFTHFIGVKYHGIKYIKQFIGPVWWLIPIFLPIEVIGHLARVLSLSFRLFGNMNWFWRFCSCWPALSLPRCRSWSWEFSWHSFRPLSSSCCQLCISPVPWRKHIKR